MAHLNPCAPHFIPAMEAPAFPSPFLSPFSCTYGYPYSLPLPHPMPDQLPPPWGFLQQILPTSAFAVHQLPCYDDYYYGVPQQTHQPLLLQQASLNFTATYAWSFVETGIGYPFQVCAGTEADLGVLHLPWLPHPFIPTAAPFLPSPQPTGFPFNPALPFQPEDLPPPPPPPPLSWQPLLHPVQPEILELPPKTRPVPTGNPPPRAVVLRKKRVRVSPRSRVKVAAKNGGASAWGTRDHGGCVVGGNVQRGPRLSRCGAICSMWVPKLRRHRRKSPDEEKLYEQFEFKGSGSAPESSEGGDERTTVMIKNIPNKITAEWLLSILDSHCREENTKVWTGGQVALQDGRQAGPSRFDFFYLPVDFGTGCNLGYAFVNFTSAAAARRLHTAFHQSLTWGTYRSKKVCEVTYARIQGLAALLKHFWSTTFLCDHDELLPVHFVPHRDDTFQGVRHHVGRRICSTSRR